MIGHSHPSERAAIAASASNRVEIDAAIIDESASVYPAFATSYSAVSELSGLFEAVGLADSILIWNAGKAKFAFSDHPTKVFRSEGELSNMLAVLEHSAVGAADALSEANWCENYLSFLRGSGMNVGEQVWL